MKKIVEQLMLLSFHRCQDPTPGTCLLKIRIFLFYPNNYLALAEQTNEVSLIKNGEDWISMNILFYYFDYGQLMDIISSIPLSWRECTCHSLGNQGDAMNALAPLSLGFEKFIAVFNRISQTNMEYYWKNNLPLH